MKKIKLLAMGLIGVIALAGCTGASTPENVQLTIPELGLVITVPATWTYENVVDDRYRFKTPGDSRTLTVEPFAPPAVPAEAVASSQGLADAIEGVTPDFVLTSQTDFDNGFVINYTVNEVEGFSSISNLNGDTFLCEPEDGAYVFEFEDFTDICKSIQLAE